MCSSCFELLPEASSQKQHEKRRQDTELACVRDSIDFASAWKVLWALRGVLNLDDVTIPVRYAKWKVVFFLFYLLNCIVLCSR